MNCSHTRQILYPQPDRAETAIESVAARAHLRQCAECRDYFRQEAVWSCALREKLGREVAPARLRDGVFAEIQKHRAALPLRHFRAKRLLYAASVLLLLAAALVVPSLYRLPSEQFFQEVCADHAKYLGAESQLRSSDPAQVESWFHDKAAFGVAAPHYQDATLLGSRLCLLKRHKAALIFYRKGGHPISLFQMDSDGINLSALSRSVIDSVPIWHKSINGFSLVAMKRRGVLWVLVSDLSESDLLPLAFAPSHQF